MKRPEIIMHNSISLDGRVTGFGPDMGQHYGIVGSYKADYYMAGSNTAATGIELYGGAPPETEGDFARPKRGPGLSYWLVPDSRGSLMGRLHALRRNEYCRDVVLLLSKRTGQDYIDYLENRDYEYIVCGEDRVDYRTAFECLRETHGAERILVDSGPTLSGILLKQGLVDEISLLVHPCLAGNKALDAFRDLDLEDGAITLELKKQEALVGGLLWMVWRVLARGKE